MSLPKEAPNEIDQFVARGGQVQCHIWHQFGMPAEAVRRWADWYGMPYLSFVGFAFARMNATEGQAFGISPGDGEGMPLTADNAIYGWGSAHT